MARKLSRLRRLDTPVTHSALRVTDSLYSQQIFNEVRHLKRKNLFILGVPGGGHADERLMTIKRRVGSSTQGSGARPVKQ